MSAHKHAYRRLSDVAVFCAECGDIKTVAEPVCIRPHYPYWPTWIWTDPYTTAPRWYPPFYVTSGGTAPDPNTYTVWNTAGAAPQPALTTYTLTAGGQP